MIEQFHFLRPGWLLALPLLAAALWLLRRRGYDSGNWRSVIDPVLMPHVLSGALEVRGNRVAWLVASVAALAIVALAGPTWEKREQSVFQQQAALVIALDLSRSMDAADVRPSRLVRARHKIADILGLRDEGQTALLVYAADAYAVTPLTSDVETILALLPDLETDLMPAQGTRADRAVSRALELLANGGAARGDLLLVTDAVSEREADAIENLLGKHPGLRLSVLAVGTPEGGPVPLSSGDFLKDGDGDIVVVRLNAAGLRRIAELGGGAYSALSADDLDITTLNRVLVSSIDAGETLASDRRAGLWRELGPSLLLLALPLAALTFRRGLLWLAPLLLLAVPPDADAFDWQALWQNDNQRALQLLEDGQAPQAARLFDNDNWRAVANYRAGDFAGAAEQWQQLDGVDAGYNYATSLARQGLYEEALAAYDRLLEQHPQHEDAKYNRDAIDEWLRRQPPQQQSQAESEQSRQQSGEQGEQQQANRQSAPDESGDESQSDSAGHDQQSADQNRQGSQSGQQSSRQESAGERPSEGSAQQEAQQAQAQQPQPGTETDDGAGEGQDLANLDQQMSQQAAQQWLRKIPDDPGGLLRRKFRYQYRERGITEREEQAW